MIYVHVTMSLPIVKTIEKEGKDKSKVQYLLEGKSEWKPGKRPEYVNKLIRNQVSLVFQARTRMIKVKENYKKGQRNLICRVCRTQVETQQHILEECVELHEDETTKVTKDDIFKEDVYHLKEIANKLQKTMEKLTQFKAWAFSRGTLWSGYMHKERKCGSISSGKC